MRKILGKDYEAKFNPRLTRRQKLALDAFYTLSRERSYMVLGTFFRPDYIKESLISRYYENELTQPIEYLYFKMYIQGLDDIFIAHSQKEISNSGK